MATRIRLRRIGRKGVPLYRIVIADQDAVRGNITLPTKGARDVTLTVDTRRRVTSRWRSSSASCCSQCHGGRHP